MAAHSHLRIGELARRAGVSPELLRAWETRYGLLRPTRTSGGFRLYSEEDLARVERMLRYRAEGLSAAEAARAAARPEPEDAPGAADVGDEVARLAAALEAFDEAGAHGSFDRLVSALGVDALVRIVILPVLVDLGDRWEAGTATVAQEHFASNLIRGRLLGLARGWGQGVGPHALLACAPSELHELGLICFGLALRARGWRVTYLGADTPVETLVGAVTTLRPELVVVAALSPGRLKPVLAPLREVGADTRVALGGRGATAKAAEESGAELLLGDPVTGAEAASP